MLGALTDLNKKICTDLSCDQIRIQSRLVDGQETDHRTAPTIKITLIHVWAFFILLFFPLGPAGIEPAILLSCDHSAPSYVSSQRMLKFGLPFTIIVLL